MKSNRPNILYALQVYSYFAFFTFSTYFITHLLLRSLEISATPTIKPYDKFDAEKDAETIHQIVRREPKFIPDVNKMVRMVCHRDRKQRLELKDKFAEKYKGEMPIELYCAASADGELSFGDLLDDCFRSVLEVYQCHLHRELTFKFKTLDKEAIVEILLSIPPEKKQEFLSAYNATFNHPITDDIEKHLRDDFRNIIEEMVNRTRGPDIPRDKINWYLAEKEAQLLHDGRKKWNNNRCDLDRILMETPIQQLNATFVEFQKIARKEIEEVFDEHMEKDKRGSYESMVLFAKNKYDYYARRIQKAMKGVGTKDHTINRIVSIHSEDDIKEIATAFQLNTADSLIAALESETIAHQKMLITCLAGKPILKENF